MVTTSLFINADRHQKWHRHPGYEPVSTRPARSL